MQWSFFVDCILLIPKGHHFSYAHIKLLVSVPVQLPALLFIAYFCGVHKYFWHCYLHTSLADQKFSLIWGWKILRFFPMNIKSVRINKVAWVCVTSTLSYLSLLTLYWGQECSSVRERPSMTAKNNWVQRKCWNNSKYFLCTKSVRSQRQISILQLFWFGGLRDHPLRT